MPQEYWTKPDFETKEQPAYLASVDEDQGIIEQYVAICGNVDDGRDVIQYGAFTKTLQERADRIRVLDQHDRKSIKSVIGRPISFRQVPREELPEQVLARAPQATGGLLATIQFAMQTDQGRNAFHLVKGGFLNEASIGYEAIRVGWMPDPPGGQKDIRVIKKVRLWEVSLVVFAMNSASLTVSAKGLGQEGEQSMPVHPHGRGEYR